MRAVCTLCAREGHRAHACPWQEAVVECRTCGRAVEHECGHTHCANRKTLTAAGPVRSGRVAPRFDVADGGDQS